MKTKNTTIPPGEVVLSEIGLMTVVKELQPEFPKLNKSTVWRWSQQAPTGTGGTVPSRYHQPLVRLANRLGRKLTADDLVFGRRAAGG